MVGAGILDPVKVTRSALQNATSVASTLLTTESVVATIKEDAPAMPGRCYQEWVGYDDKNKILCELRDWRHRR